MAKNFKKAGSVQIFSEVAKVEQEKAQVIAIANIRSEDLIDNPQNGEDISYTEDLEESIRQLGFTDPLEVTDYGMESGKYMILSGHRRRMAGTKMGIEVFPCVVRHFKNENELQNYTLLSNSQRDSAKDPFLFSRRYKMHEQYLKDIGFKGSKREEIAKRLGLSIQQADRYNTMNKIILPVWDLVRAEIVGMSSVQAMAKHSPDEQQEIYSIMQEALKDGRTLTRDCMKDIVSSYRSGKKTWDDMKRKDVSVDEEETEKSPVKQDQEPIPVDDGNNNTFSESPQEEVEIESPHGEEISLPHTIDGEEAESGVENEESTHKPVEVKLKDEKKSENDTDKSKGKKNAENIKKLLDKIDTAFTDIYEFDNSEDAKKTLLSIAQICNMMIDEMSSISNRYNMDDLFFTITRKIKDELRNYTE